MTTESDSYQASLRDGRLLALEQLTALHDDRLTKLEQTMKLQEKVTWTLIGAISLVNFLPELRGLLS